MSDVFKRQTKEQVQRALLDNFTMVFTEHLSPKARMYNVYLAVASIEDTPQTGLQWLWWLWILYSHSLHMFCCSCPLQEPQTTHVSFYRKFICCFKHPEVKVSWLDPLAMAVTWKPRLVSHAMLQVQAPRSRDVAEDSECGRWSWGIIDMERSCESGQEI